MVAFVAVTLVLSPTAGAGDVPGVAEFVTRELAAPDFDAPLFAHANSTDLIRFSHYWPPWLGFNCDRVVNGECVSRTASGDRWQTWVRRGAACPRHLPFGTVIVFAGREWTCVDRGPAVVGRWIDFMTPVEYHPYGKVVRAEIIVEEEGGRIPPRGAVSVRRGARSNPGLR